MPRPRKWRKVCSLPDTNKFGPIGRGSRRDKVINLTIDEYETMRLIDLEGLTQEESAKQMGIARSTVQAIYSGARTKVTDSIVNGAVLVIAGGDYRVCDGKECGKGRACGKRRRMGELSVEKENENENSDSDRR